MILSILLSLGALISSTQCVTLDELNSKVDSIEDNIKLITSTIRDLARQTMVQQYATEEGVRTNGDSGVLQVRGLFRGPENYYGSSHNSVWSYMSIHDHANYDRTMGMGEVGMSLNGVNFRTRHNDYKLKMAHPTSSKYHATVDVPLPEVPEAVTKLQDVDAQIVEMREWFKAYKEQDHSVRDYRKHFKPILCYLEGTWTLDKELDEPFESDRHQLEANSWFELMENIRFTGYSGTKNRLENLAYLPTTIMSVNETTGLPNYAQWNYRILCQPLKQDIPLKYLKQEDDLSFRIPRKYPKRKEDMYFERAARFRIWEHTRPKHVKYSLIDRMMGQIPGKDNGPADLREDAFGDRMYEYENSTQRLNSGYYNRVYKFTKAGAMGQTMSVRGFNDEHCWVAMTTQRRVAPMTMRICPRGKCESYSNRFSYAIPLELIYLTPLIQWNPWNLLKHDKLNMATANGRSGTESKPLNGTDFAHHYRTPKAFFKGRTDTSNPADTVKGSVHVLDRQGVPRVTMASGTKIVLEDIEGVGRLRLRFPLAPVHGEGSNVWKEVNALRDYVFTYAGTQQQQHHHGMKEVEHSKLPAVINFKTKVTTTPTQHYHTFEVDRDDYIAMKGNSAKHVKVTTSQDAGHTHDLVIRYRRDLEIFEYYRCDNLVTCWDKHPKSLLET